MNQGTTVKLGRYFALALMFSICALEHLYLDSNLMR